MAGEYEVLEPQNDPFLGGGPSLFSDGVHKYVYIYWLVVSTHLKNISQNGNLPQVGVKIKNISNHHLVYIMTVETLYAWLKFFPTPFPNRGTRSVKGGFSTAPSL